LRHRLRFLLQELDLPHGETLIGRSPDCLITLDDPLVSRRHGRLLIRGEEAIFEDLGSRNGSRVNGRRVHEPVHLKEGDRLRIGALELVSDKRSKAGFQPPGRAGAVFAAKAQEHGLICRNLVDAVALCPPLIITESEIDEMMRRFGLALDATARELEL